MKAGGLTKVLPFALGTKVFKTLPSVMQNAQRKDLGTKRTSNVFQWCQLGTWQSIVLSWFFKLDRGTAKAAWKMSELLRLRDLVQFLLRDFPGHRQ
jgi:hypothetical protein